MTRTDWALLFLEAVTVTSLFVMFALAGLGLISLFKPRTPK